MLNNDLKELETNRRVLMQKYMRMLISKREVAKELGCSRSTIDRMRCENLISSKKIRGKVMFSVDEVARVLTEG